MRRMVEALRAVERETKEPICYVISGDLAHIGPKFGDAREAAGLWLEHSREQDQAILRQAEAADPAGYFRVIAEEGDAPPHLRPAADVHGAGGDPSRLRQGAALRSVRPPARPRERQLRQHGVLSLTRLDGSGGFARPGGGSIRAREVAAKLRTPSSASSSAARSAGIAAAASAPN